MIRALVLAALVALVVSQAPLDQAEWFRAEYGRLGGGPFCDSECLADGRFFLRRDWVNLESENEDIFVWYADGGPSYWETRSGGLASCGMAVNNLVVGTQLYSDDSDYFDCRPEQIYLFKMNVYYDNAVGQLTEEIYLDRNFEPTQESWDEFVNDFFDLPMDNRYTRPWDLIRIIPTTEGSNVRSAYKNDVLFKQVFIAIYERNFCTFTGSVLPIEEQIKCEFPEDDDSDTIDFVTRDFCWRWIIGQYDEVEFRVGTTVQSDCGDSEDDVCNRMRVIDSDSRRRTENGHVLPPKRGLHAGSPLRQVMYSTRTQGKVEKTTLGEFHKSLKKARGTYDYEEQAIPEHGIVSGTLETDPFFWNEAWDEAVFYYVPYTSSITAPYCGYKQGTE